MASCRIITENIVTKPLITPDEASCGAESEKYHDIHSKNKLQSVKRNAVKYKSFNTRVFIKSDEFCEEKIDLLSNYGTEIVILPASAFAEAHKDKSDNFADIMGDSFIIQMIC